MHQIFKNMATQKKDALPKIISLLCFTILSNPNMRKHFFLKNLFGVPTKIDWELLVSSFKKSEE